MTKLLVIDDSLLRRIESIAQRDRLPADAVIETALRQYVESRVDSEASKGGGEQIELPVSTRLAQPRVDVGQSYGKLMEALDDGLPLEKLR